MDKQVTIYSIDTNDLYIEKEVKIHRIMSRGYFLRSKLKRKLKKEANDTQINKLSTRISLLNKRLDSLKKDLYAQFEINKHKTRIIEETSLSKGKEITIFNSVLTRTLNMKYYEKGSTFVNDDIIVVQVYYFEVLESIIHKGFIYKNEKYICLTASAGQIRTKKIVFIKEKLFDKHKMSLMCGLTPEVINGLGGVNINKYLAYLALCNSATDEWVFDLHKTIVVDDMELSFDCEVDHIDDVTFKIERKIEKITINHTDGCGMMLPSVSKSNFMIRMPWVKGLLVSFPFDQFIKENNISGAKIKDIYGRSVDIIKDDIQIIFTKSQFKMWKYYKSWQEYIELFYQNDCQIGICNEEEEELENKRISYQMLQTLTDLTELEISELTKKTNEKISNISKDKKTMLEVFGVRKNRDNMNYFQKSLLIYPELLEDSYTKQSLKQIKRKKVMEGKAGKLEIECKYAFACPDLYAFCEYLFLRDENPKGLLNNGEVSFSDYDSGTEIDCLRSPHLYREHAVRVNVHTDMTKKWFTTKGVYTSIHDPISRILQFDVDGDNLLLVKEEVVVKSAKRNMEGIVPLYYEMKKAENAIMSPDVMYKGLISAYTGGNIGVISNDISKVWNSEEVNIDVIKWLTALNNYTIDFAKTLYKPIVPEEHQETIKSFKNKKVPNFFIYAKDKEKDKVENINNSTMNRIARAVINKRMNFSGIGDSSFDFRMLLNDQDTNESINEITELYIKLDHENARRGIKSLEKKYSGDNVVEYNHIREEILNTLGDRYTVQQIVDSLVYYLFKEKDSSYKTAFWRCFGDVVYENISFNLKNGELKKTIPCESCRIRIEKKSNRTKFCDECFEENRRDYQKNIMKNRRNKKSVSI